MNDPRNGPTRSSSRGSHARFFINLQRDKSEIIPVSVREAVAHIGLRREAFEKQRCDFAIPDTPHNPFLEMQSKDEAKRRAAKELKDQALAAKMEARHRPLTGGGASVSAHVLAQRKAAASAAEQQAFTRPHSSPITSPHHHQINNSSNNHAHITTLRTTLARLCSATSMDCDEDGNVITQSEDDEASAVITGLAHGNNSLLRYEDIPIDNSPDEAPAVPTAVVVPLSSSRPPSSSTARPTTATNIVKKNNNAMPAAVAAPPSSASSITSPRRPATAARLPTPLLSEQLAAQAANSVSSTYAGTADLMTTTRAGEKANNTGGVASPNIIRRVHSAGVTRIGAAVVPPPSSGVSGRPPTASGLSSLARAAGLTLLTPHKPTHQQPPHQQQPQQEQNEPVPVLAPETTATATTFTPKAPREEDLLRTATAELSGVTNQLLSKTLDARRTFHSLVGWAEATLSEALGAAENERSETEPEWVAEQLKDIPELHAVAGPGASALATTLLVLNSIMTVDPAVSQTWGTTWVTIRNVLIAGLFGTDGAYRVSQEMLRGMTRFRMPEEESFARALSCVPSLTDAVQNARVRCALMKKKLDSKDDVICGLDLALAKHLKEFQHKQLRLVWRTWKDFAAKSRWQRWAKNEFCIVQYRRKLLGRIFDAWRRVSISLERVNAEKQRDAARMEAKHAKLILHKSVEEAKATLHEEVTTARRHLAEERSLRQAQVSALTMETERLLSQREELQQAVEHFSIEGRLWHNLWLELRPRFDLFELPVMTSLLAKGASNLHDAMAPLFARTGNISVLVAGDSPLIAPQTTTVFGLGTLQQTAHNRSFQAVIESSQNNNGGAGDEQQQLQSKTASQQQPQLPVDTQRQLTRTKIALHKFLLDWTNGFLAQANSHTPDLLLNNSNNSSSQQPFNRIIVQDSDLKDGIAISLIARRILEQTHTALIADAAVTYPRAAVDKITHILQHRSGDVHRAASPGQAVLNLFRVLLDVLSVYPFFPPLIQNCPFAATHFTPTKILAPEFSEWWQYLLATLFVAHATLPVSTDFVRNSSASSNRVFTDASEGRLGEIDMQKAKQQQQQQQQAQQQQAKSKSNNGRNVTTSPPTSAPSPGLSLAGTMIFRAEEIIALDRQDDGVKDDDDDEVVVAASESKPQNQQHKHDDEEDDDETVRKPKLTKRQLRELSTLGGRGPVPVQCLIGQHHFAHHVPETVQVGSKAGGGGGNSPPSSPSLLHRRRSILSSSPSFRSQTGGGATSASGTSRRGSAATTFTVRSGGGFGGGTSGALSRVASSHSISPSQTPQQQTLPPSSSSSSSPRAIATARANNNNRTASSSSRGQQQQRPQQLLNVSTSLPAAIVQATTNSPHVIPRRNAAATPTATATAGATTNIGRRGHSSGGGAGGASSTEGLSLTAGALDTHVDAMRRVLESQHAQWKSLLERWQHQVKWESLFDKDVARQLLKATSTPVRGLAGINSNNNNNKTHSSNSNNNDGHAQDEDDTLSVAGSVAATERSAGAAADDDVVVAPPPPIRGPLRFYHQHKLHNQQQQDQQQQHNQNHNQPLEAAAERKRGWEQTVRQRGWYSAARLVATAIAEFHVLEWIPEQNSFRSAPTPVFTIVNNVVAPSSDSGSSPSGGSRTKRRASIVRRRSTLHSLGGLSDAHSLAASSSVGGGGGVSLVLENSGLVPQGIREIGSRNTTVAIGGGDSGVDSEHEAAVSAVFEQHQDENEEELVVDDHQQQQQTQQRQQARRPQQPRVRRETAVEQQVSVVSSLLFNEAIMRELERK